MPEKTKVINRNFKCANAALMQINSVNNSFKLKGKVRFQAGSVIKSPTLCLAISALYSIGCFAEMKCNIYVLACILCAKKHCDITSIEVARFF